MRLLERVLESVKPKTFSGTVVDIIFVSGEGRHNFHKQWVTLSHGYDREGMPIRETYLEGVYDVTLRNPDGTQRTFRVFGKPPEVESKQTYRLNSGLRYINPPDEIMERKRWGQLLAYWCKDAETSPKAADIESMAAREGFRGERLRHSSTIDPKLRYKDMR